MDKGKQGVAGGGWHLALEGSIGVVRRGGGAICSHTTNRQPTITSVTRSTDGSYPIMSGMLAVTRLRLFLLSVASAWYC